MFQDAHTAIPLGFLLAFLIGPVFFVILETAAIKGFRAALAVDLGVILADILFIFIIYFSTNKILEKIKDDPALFIFGGLLLVTYGVFSFIKEKRNYHNLRQTSVRITNKNNYFRLFIKGFFLNFINIGVLGFWLSVVIVMGPQLEMDTNRIWIFFSIVLSTYITLDIFKMLLAKRLKNKLTPRRVYTVKRIISFILIFFGVFLILKGLVPDTVEEKIEESIKNITH